MTNIERLLDKVHAAGGSAVADSDWLMVVEVCELIQQPGT